MVSGSHLCPEFQDGTIYSAALQCSDSLRSACARQFSGLGDLGVCCNCWTSLSRKLWGCLQNMKFAVVKGVRLQSSYLVVKHRVGRFFSTNRCWGELKYLLLLLFNDCFSAKDRGVFWCRSAVRSGLCGSMWENWLTRECSSEEKLPAWIRGVVLLRSRKSTNKNEIWTSLG